MPHVQPDAPGHGLQLLVGALVLDGKQGVMHGPEHALLRGSDARPVGTLGVAVHGQGVVHPVNGDLATVLLEQDRQGASGPLAIRTVEIAALDDLDHGVAVAPAWHAGDGRAH